MNSAVNQVINRLVRAVSAAVMRRSGVVAGLVVLVLGVSVSLFQPSASARNESQGLFTLKGRVVKVADGDTFTLLADGRTQRVRLASIDAPEVGKGNDQPGQPWGQASRQSLSGLIAGKTLTLPCYERDHYGRAICDVVLPGGASVNRQQVQAGMAWANTEKHGLFLRDETLVQVQRQAQQAGLGLWRDTDPVPPWVWRYQCWREGQC